jgi:hypothetical protein
MIRLFNIMLLCSAAILSSCATRPDVAYADLTPSTTATVSGNRVTIHLGSNLLNSACWTRISIRIEEKTVRLSGSRTLWEQPQEVCRKLPAKAAMSPWTVVWKNPDGSLVKVPLIK